MRVRHSGRATAALIALCLIPAVPQRAAAQQGGRIDVYRFVLDVDVPESPALVALDRTGVRVLRGSAPKPVALAVGAALAGAPSGAAAALDLSPYYVLGGGVRTLASYRDNSLEGRVKRVLTKTLLSIAAVRESGTPASTRLGLGLRATFHDPHDPVLNSDLPERVARELAAHGVEPLEPTEEDAADRGVELGPLLAASRREMRARCCVQVSAGWGLAGVLRGDVASRDSLREVRQTVWAAAQFTLGRRFDILATAEARSAFRAGAYGRVGAALQRKGSATDVRAELLYDGADRHLHPGLGVELRAIPRTAVVLTAASRPGGAGAGPPRLETNLLVRGFLAARQP